MKYFLMRKDEIITTLDFSEDGTLLKWDRDIQDEALAPLLYRNDKNNWIKRWWNERTLSFDNVDIKSMLLKAGYDGPKEYLIDNLGLSLNDYYWVCPIDSNLTWDKINLFSNPFAEDIFINIKKKECGASSFSPNATLQGQIEKTWQIKNGKRVLIKGNLDDTSLESMNEIFASLLHKKQAYTNYVPYKLIKIKHRNYVYGCQCECFTDENHELVTAWAILNSKKIKKNNSVYENFIDICVENGMNEDDLRHNLEYMIMTDYILSNRDRHLNNIGVLRNADTLRFEKLAPIYDTGRSMFIRRSNLAYSDIVNGKINSFCDEEEKMLALVRDRSLVDFSKLPTIEDLEKIYCKDASISEDIIRKIAEWYKVKLDVFASWQKGYK